MVVKSTKMTMITKMIMVTIRLVMMMFDGDHGDDDGDHDDHDGNDDWLVK